jgi:hypothetical protein
MRMGVGIRMLSTSLLAIAGLTGCGGGSAGVAEGRLAMTVAPMPPALAGLALSDAGLLLEQLTVLGDVEPDWRSMAGEVRVDLLGGAQSVGFASLPQGYYSKVRFTIEAPTLDGSWQGAPLHVRLFDVGYDDEARVELRLPSGVDVEPGRDAQLDITLDVGSWFGAADLDGAAREPNGDLLVDRAHNAALQALMQSRVFPSCTLSDASPGDPE